jgi:hypothetical protein
MIIDKDIRRLIGELRQPYQIIKRRDHYFLHVPGHKPIIVAGNSKSTHRRVVETAHDLEKIIKEQRGE